MNANILLEQFRKWNNNNKRIARNLTENVISELIIN